MSVVVRMEMPSKDKRCEMADEIKGTGIWFCPIKQQYCHQPDNRIIPSWCPIICALPEGHGRLIDADKLKAKKYHSNITNENAVAVAEIDWAETIVPAERSEHEAD